MTETAAETFHRMSATDPNVVALRTVAGLAAEHERNVERFTRAAHTAGARVEHNPRTPTPEQREAARRAAELEALRSVGVAFELVQWARAHERPELGLVRLGPILDERLDGTETRAYRQRQRAAEALA